MHFFVQGYPVLAVSWLNHLRWSDHLPKVKIMKCNEMHNLTADISNYQNYYCFELGHGYCTDSRPINAWLLHRQLIWIKPLFQNRDVIMWSCPCCVAVTMGAQLDLYKTYYPNTNTNPDPKPNPNSHPHLGIVVRSKSAMHRQTGIALLMVHGSTIFRRFFKSVWRRFLCCVLSSGVSHIKQTICVCCSNKSSTFCNSTKVLTDVPTLNTLSDISNDGMRIPML